MGQDELEFVKEKQMCEKCCMYRWGLGGGQVQQVGDEDGLQQAEHHQGTSTCPQVQSGWIRIETAPPSPSSAQGLGSSELPGGAQGCLPLAPGLNKQGDNIQP